MKITQCDICREVISKDEEVKWIYRGHEFMTKAIESLEGKEKRKEESVENIIAIFRPPREFPEICNSCTIKAMRASVTA